MKYRDWHVGMKLVCVNNARQEAHLRLNRIYTIAAIGTAFGRLYVGLVEVPGSGPINWYAHRFRPAQPRKTDISIFTAMLGRQKVPA